MCRTKWQNIILDATPHSGHFCIVCGCGEGTHARTNTRTREHLHDALYVAVAKVPSGKNRPNIHTRTPGVQRKNQAEERAMQERNAKIQSVPQTPGTVGVAMTQQQSKAYQYKTEGE